MKKIITTISLSLMCLSSFAQSNAGSRNASASCDSTCMAQATAVSQESNLQQRVVPCVTGFTGTKLQTRVKLPDGTWGPWIDKDVENCKCEPTTETRNEVCPSGQSGKFMQGRNWTCTTPKSGVWSDWQIISNTCKSDCVELAPESRTVRCADIHNSDWNGSVNQTRYSRCTGTSETPVWGEWYEVSNTCSYSPSNAPVRDCVPLPDKVVPIGTYCSPHGQYREGPDGYWTCVGRASCS